MKLPVHVLTKLINETVFAVLTTREPSNSYWSPLCFKRQFFTSCRNNSHRLSQRVIPVEQAVDQFDIFIPR